MKEKLKARTLPAKEIAYIHRFKKKNYKYKNQKLSLSKRSDIKPVKKTKGLIHYLEDSG